MFLELRILRLAHKPIVPPPPLGSRSSTLIRARYKGSHMRSHFLYATPTDVAFTADLRVL